MTKIKQELQWTKKEANRCLYCVDAPCAKGCPAAIDVPQFIRHLRYGNIKSAKEVIMSANPFGTICGTLCPSEKLCEKECVLNARVESPIHIRDLQKFICENAEYERPIAKSNDKKVAIVGAGPASLSCASELVLMGYNVDVFEKGGELGGVIESEIPGHRIPKSSIDEDIKLLESSGITIHYNIEVKEENLKEYMNKYDAVFLGIGLNKEREVGIELDADNNIFGSGEFLTGIKSGEIAKPKGTVIVIGGGDSAIDVATASLVNGAEKAIVAYRRTKKEMPATNEEFLGAVELGAELMYLVSPVSVEQKNDALEVTFTRNKLIQKEEDGRQGYEAIKGSEFTLSTDVLVFAVGKFSDFVIGDTQKAKKIRVKDTNCFVGGDYANGGGTIVRAVRDGKKAAQEINNYLSE